MGIENLQWHLPHSDSSDSTDSRSNRNLIVVLVFVEGGKPESPEKNPQSKDKNQQQTQPTYDSNSGNQTWATLVGGERSHHCVIPAHPKWMNQSDMEISNVLFQKISIPLPRKIFWFESPHPSGNSS